ncbi:nose resistant to fluoxetine protein 6-like [Culicoides brevitarsis]|uniref:nose resistant to fluoxetine protein 6-like n=1 Tax=Culicoides brevitarsis TaxID=469753 RepID=UPI00307C9FD1
MEPGFVWGNNYWTSSKELCQVLREPLIISLSPRYERNHHQNLSTARPPFLVNYQVVHIKHDSKYQIEQKIYDKSIVHIGLCFPTVCDPKETSMLVDQVLQRNKEEYFLIGANYTILDAKHTTASERALGNVFLMLTLIGLSIILLLVIFGTIYGKCLRKPFWNNVVLTPDKKVSDGNEMGVKALQNTTKQSLISEIFTSFSISDNYQKLTSIHMTKKSLSAIHGLSGFLLAYTFFDHLKETEGKAAKNPIRLLWKAILLRYLRLAIPYIPAFLFTTSLAFYLRDASTYHFIEQTDYNCEHYWWRNFLFINNWWKMSDMCMTNSWYLSADFQCFLITIILLVLSLRFPKTSIFGFVLVFLGSCIYSGYVGWTENFSYLLDVQFNSIDTLYYPTYTRIGGYLVGVFSGWLFVKLDEDLKLNKVFVVIGWIIALTINLSLFLAQVFRVENQYLGMFFAGICRPMYCGTIMWIVFMCSRGYGGIVTKILGSPSLVVISRLSFAAYLVNPILIYFVSMISDVPFHIELVSTTITVVGYVYLIYRLATVFSLLFEFPFTQIIKKVCDRMENRSENNNNKDSTHL